MSTRKIVNKALMPLGVKLTKLKSRKMIGGCTLDMKHMRNSQLLPNRDHILDHLPKHGKIAEVGVLFGEFTEKIINKLEPRECVAIDLYEMHNASHIWWQSPQKTFGNLTHEEFVADKLNKSISSGITKLVKGFSHEVLASYPDDYFDIIYLDAAHDYDSVKLDVEQCKRKISSNGWLVFNDYIMGDFIEGIPYGVIPVVNDLCINDNWEIRYFALHPTMYCDIALTKIQP